MPPNGYLTINGIRTAIQHIATQHSDLAQEIELPEESHEGRKIHALKIAKGSGSDRRAVLFLGGVHARELINPDGLVALGLKLCNAYQNGTGLTFGGKTFEAGTIKLIVENLDVWMIPLVNPDGRRFVQQQNGDPWWRKNRNPNPGLPCDGVDLNRNCDFLWSSGIGTSTDSCSDVFKGSGAFSEPETRNVRHMLDTYPNIGFMVDVHSYSELFLHPWGDDDNQTTDPSQNFTNPAFNGIRGTPGDNAYREYIEADDLDWFVDTGASVRDAIAAVRGHVYTSKQSVLLYPTSGTTKDYAYSRHRVDASKRKVFAYTLETGQEFQPPYSEALQVMDEAAAGLLQFCVAAVCAVQSLAADTVLADRLDSMRSFRDDELLTRAAGRRRVAQLQRHTPELLEIVSKDDELRDRVVKTLHRVSDLIDGDGGRRVVDAELVAEVDRVAEALSERAGDELQATLKELRYELHEAEGKSVLEALGPEEPQRTFSRKA